MEPKDTSKRHFYISLIKSLFRVAAGFVLIVDDIAIAGMLLIFAELLGVAEEL